MPRRTESEAMNIPRTHHGLTRRRLRRFRSPSDHIAAPQPARHRVTLVLAGITAEDYLQWIRDPDPPARTDVQLISARAVRPGERIELELRAHGRLPALQAAAHAVGFPITPEVIGIHITPPPASTHTPFRAGEPLMC